MKFGAVLELEKKEHFEILGHSVSSSGVPRGSGHAANSTPVMIGGCDTCR